MDNYGFFVRGDHGQYQIDGVNPGINLLNKQQHNLSGGRVRSSPRGPGERGYWVSPLSHQPATVLVAVNSATWTCVNWDATGFYLGQPLDASAGLATLYEFGTGSGVWPSSDYGLSVFNADGVEVFNSNWRPLRVHDAIVVNSYTSYSMSLPAGRQYAIAFSGGADGQKKKGGASDIAEFWRCYCRIINNQLEVNYFSWQWFVMPVDVFSETLFPMSILIIDVTNY